MASDVTSYTGNGSTRPAKLNATSVSSWNCVLLFSAGPCGSVSQDLFGLVQWHREASSVELRRRCSTVCKSLHFSIFSASFRSCSFVCLLLPRNTLPSLPYGQNVTPTTVSSIISCVLAGPFKCSETEFADGNIHSAFINIFRHLQMALHIFSFYRQLRYPLFQVPFTFYIATYLFYEVGLFTNPSKTYFHEA